MIRISLLRRPPDHQPQPPTDAPPSPRPFPTSEPLSWPAPTHPKPKLNNILIIISPRQEPDLQIPAGVCDWFLCGGSVPGP
ncbi:hypothetical protein E2C01_090092 [Portunus trituberculatus]|uniref:Uncharacterized protein n=1 Tax=Portunus trituberculatus TaxID=210409 RepID=A0A5B7JFA8_PORTR|nr:hypothetical protein [Portunus trituberculatus]